MQVTQLNATVAQMSAQQVEMAQQMTSLLGALGTVNFTALRQVAAQYIEEHP